MTEQEIKNFLDSITEENGFVQIAEPNLIAMKILLSI